MQKVEGSNPFSRFDRNPAPAGFSTLATLLPDRGYGRWNAATLDPKACAVSSTQGDTCPDRGARELQPWIWLEDEAGSVGPCPACGDQADAAFAGRWD